MKPYKEINPSATSLSQIDFKSGQLFRGEGFIKYDDLPRVCAEIKARAPNYSSDSNGVKWSLLSSIDELVGGGQDYRIQLDLEFKYPLECQRCLEIYEEKLNTSSVFILKNTQEEVDNFPLDNDDEDALLNSHHFDLIELFEDEILLNLPLKPKHPIEECHPKDILVVVLSDEDSTEILLDEDRISTTNPFANLKKLKFDA